MSSFFSDDEDASSRPDARPSQGRGRGRRAPPRLARHLRPNDGPAQLQPQPHNADASSSTFPSSPRVGRDTSFFKHDSESAGDVTGMTTFDMDSDPLFAAAAARGKSSRRLVDLDRDALLGGAGDIPLLPGEDSNLPNDALHESDDDEPRANDVTRLLTAWIRERGTPDLMTWHGELVEECLHKLGQQAEMLDLLRSDPKTSEEEHFKLIIVQTEMERVKYLVRAYLRCRLAKVGRARARGSVETQEAFRAGLISSVCRSKSLHSTSPPRPKHNASYPNSNYLTHKSTPPPAPARIHSILSTPDPLVGTPNSSIRTTPIPYSNPSPRNCAASKLISARSGPWVRPVSCTINQKKIR